MAEVFESCLGILAWHRVDFVEQQKRDGCPPLHVCIYYWVMCIENEGDEAGLIDGFEQLQLSSQAG